MEKQYGKNILPAVHFARNSFDFGDNILEGVEVLGLYLFHLFIVFIYVTSEVILCQIITN